ncbi:hypothetical protein [Bacillus sp. WP8]|nr:hypothetical protein [Bacillus sp. WP8]
MKELERKGMVTGRRKGEDNGVRLVGLREEGRRRMEGCKIEKEGFM